MSLKMPQLLSKTAVAALFCSASLAMAAPTVCTVVPSNATYDATIGVASNFYGPAQDLVSNWVAAGGVGTNKHIRVCQNSTAALDTEIRAGNANSYSLFLAANASTPNALVGTTYVPSTATSNLYARGIPVVFGLTTNIANVGTLISGLGSGTSATISSTSLSSQPLLTTNAQTVAVADPAAAPYGAAAASILGSMTLWGGTTPLPAWMHNPLYANIDVTYQAVIGGTDKTGFVSKSQICGNLGTVTYVEFTGFLLDQKGILVKSGSPAQDVLGASIRNFMLSNSSPTYWPNFLAAHCYAAI